MFDKCGVWRTITNSLRSTRQYSVELLFHLTDSCRVVSSIKVLNFVIVIKLHFWYYYSGIDISNKSFFFCLQSKNYLSAILVSWWDKDFFYDLFFSMPILICMKRKSGKLWKNCGTYIKKLFLKYLTTKVNLKEIRNKKVLCELFFINK